MGKFKASDFPLGTDINVIYKAYQEHKENKDRVTASQLRSEGIPAGTKTKTVSSTSGSHTTITTKADTLNTSVNPAPKTKMVQETVKT